MRKLCFWLMAVTCLVSWAGEKRALTFDDFFNMKRIGNPSAAPDGKSILFRVQQAQVDSNNYASSIFLLDVASGDIKRMTPEEQNCASPVWRPDGKAFAYTSGGQIYLKTLDGSAPTKVTAATEGASGPEFSADGQWLLFTSTLPRSTKPAESSAKIIDSLMFRQWNEWRDNLRNHVFLVSSSAKGEPGRDLTSNNYDAPPLDLGSNHDYTFSPDGKEVAYVKNTDAMVAASTNNDIFLLDLASGEETRMTTSLGGDCEPYYSPDGRYIAFASMARAGFEADEHVLTLYDRSAKTHKALSAGSNLSTGGYLWAPDSQSLFFTAENKGARSIFRIDLSGKVSQLTDTYYDGNLSIDASGATVFFTREATEHPAELFAMDLATKQIHKLTDLNGPALVDIEMNPWEEFWFNSPNGKDQVQGFMVKPPFFDPNKKYPMTFLIHGGPQGMWGNSFHYRWNVQMFAAPGQVVVLINPHGSHGYGQPFCDAVSKDWGGLPYQDLMTGLDEALKRYPFIDKDRLSAAGASYGGFMINWIAGHKHPFKALVSHDGVFNMPSMGFATEELWFSEWEFGGSYLEHPELYEKFSPNHYAKNFNTPMLVIHSELDYRVPVNQGIELFTAHQRKGVPSRWLYFPDEDHWISKPKNAKVWWSTIYDWIGTYTKSESPAHERNH